MSGTADEPYKLVSELYAHDGPVRCISFGPNGEIVTGCQSDAPSMRRWALVREGLQGPELTEIGAAVQHSHWVTALTHLPANSNNAVYPEGALVTGCQDSIIRIFSPRTGELMLELEGHKKGVISFSWTSTGQLISGSWDGTAKVWDLAAGGECVLTLPNHENGVNVLGLENGQIVTTSTGENVNDKPANFYVRFWDPATGKQIGGSIKDHEGPIRCIAPLSGIASFVTASNDGTVRVRTADSTGGDMLAVMSHPPSPDGSAPILLHCAPLTSSTSACDIVSCGEDGTVIVWNSAFEQAQVIPHPSCVWCALALPGTDGDFLTASHDGFVRLFSKNPALTNTMAAIQLNEQLLAAAQQARDKLKAGSGPTAEEIAKCPLWSDRGNRRGRSEGDVCLFNKDGTIIAAQWGEREGAWVEVGEVTGRGNSGTVQGVAYDHVMPVEMEAGGGQVVTLQLGYNTGENPFVAAQRFIDQNPSVLSQRFLQQIADWIIARAGRDATPTIGGPSSSSSSSASSAPSSSSSSSSSSAPAAAAAAATRSTSVFTFSTQAYLVHDDVPSAAAMEKVLNKIKDLSAASPSPLSAPELDHVGTTLQLLAATSQYHISSISTAQLAVLAKMAAWEPASAFPAFDLARMVAMHPAGAAALAKSPLGKDVVSHALKAASVRVGTPLPTVLTALRFLCNAFRHDELRACLLRSSDCLSSFFVEAAASDLAQGKLPGTKLHRIALASLAFNLSVHFSVSVARGNSEAALAVSNSGTITACNSTLCKLFTSETESADVVSRALRALGMLCAAWGVAGGVLSDSTKAGLAAAVAVAANEWGARLDESSKQSLSELSIMFSS